MIHIITSVAWILSFVLTIYASYFALISIFSLFPKRKGEKFQPKHKFAALIPARNEAFVIGNLIDSLQNQNYPKELLDIIVIPNNCTDRTRQVAVENGAKIFDCIGIIKSKGDALTEFFNDVLKNEDVYDGFCIFDADNVVSRDFMAEMNNAMCRGVRVGQGYRDSKNPYDTMISSCYSVYYYMVNRFHNHARSILKLSAMINGSGFMVSGAVIKQQGGWNTVTMTEDIEFTTRCVLAGEKVQWIPDAIVFDEQPLTFAESWKQRKRWSTGLLQGLERYSGRLLKHAILKKSISSMDLILFFIAPFMQIGYFMSILLTVILNIFYISHDYFPQTDLFYRLFLSINYSYLASFGLACVVVLMEHKKIFKMFKGIIGYWVFIISWLPINILCIFKKQTEWLPINHSRDIKINELVHQSELELYN